MVYFPTHLLTNVVKAVVPQTPKFSLEHYLRFAMCGRRVLTMAVVHHVLAKIFPHDGALQWHTLHKLHILD